MVVCMGEGSVVQCGRRENPLQGGWAGNHLAGGDMKSAFATLPRTCGRPWAGFPTLFWLLVGLGFLLRLVLAFLPLEQLLILLEDDAWMVAAIARNLALGRGITADGLHPTNGFHPLYPLTLGALPYLLAPQALDGGLRASLLFCALLSTAASFPLFSLTRRFAGEKGALLAVALYTLNPYFARVTVNAMETALGLFLLLLSAEHFFRFDRRHWPAALGAGFLAGLSGLARLDNWLLSALLGLVLLGETLRQRLLPSVLLAYGSGVALPALPYFLWNALTFGSLFPSSGRALAYMHSYADGFSLTNILHFIYLNPALYLGFLPHGLPALGIGLGLLAAYLGGLPRSVWRVLLPVAGYALLLLGYYAYFQQNSNPRYFVGPAAFFCLLLGALYGRLSPRLRPTTRWLVPLLVLAPALGLNTFEVVDTYTRSASMPQLTQPAIYQAALWLREHPDAIPTTSLLAAKNSGILQYYSDHVVLNIDGKLNAEIVPVLERRELYTYLCAKDVAYLVDREGAIAGHLTLYSHEFGDRPAHREVKLLERVRIYLQLLLNRLGLDAPPVLDDPSGFHPTRPFREAVEVVQTFPRPNTAEDPVRIFRLRCPPPQPAPLPAVADAENRKQPWPTIW